MKIRTHEGNADVLLRRAVIPACSVGLAWLGQAGFLVKTTSLTLLIDPYLSDSLAQKYRGKEFAHQRMMPAPLKPENLQGIHAVFCTHRHGDHMDPGTLPVLAESNPECRFFIPRAELDSALRIGLPGNRIEAINAGESFALTPDAHVSVIPSAHETLRVNDRGEHHYLGYIMQFGNLKLYHAGDCVPYEGLMEKLASLPIDLALLPINGRDEFRRSRGVPGNMTLDEAIQLCRNASIPLLVPHHFGMFAFNTIDPKILIHQANMPGNFPQIMLPRIDFWLELATSENSGQ